MQRGDHWCPDFDGLLGWRPADGTTADHSHSANGRGPGREPLYYYDPDPQPTLVRGGHWRYNVHDSAALPNKKKPTPRFACVYPIGGGSSMETSAPIVSPGAEVDCCLRNVRKLTDEEARNLVRVSLVASKHFACVKVKWPTQHTDGVVRCNGRDYLLIVTERHGSKSFAEIARATWEKPNPSAAAAPSQQQPAPPSAGAGPAVPENAKGSGSKSAAPSALSSAERLQRTFFHLLFLLDFLHRSGIVHGALSMECLYSGSTTKLVKVSGFESALVRPDSLTQSPVAERERARWRRRMDDDAVSVGQILEDTVVCGFAADPVMRGSGWDAARLVVQTVSPWALVQLQFGPSIEQQAAAREKKELQQRQQQQQGQGGKPKQHDPTAEETVMQAAYLCSRVALLRCEVQKVGSLLLFVLRKPRQRCYLARWLIALARNPSESSIEILKQLCASGAVIFEADDQGKQALYIANELTAELDPKSPHGVAESPAIELEPHYEEMVSACSLGSTHGYSVLF